jgi:hypothetical protein
MKLRFTTLTMLITLLSPIAFARSEVPLTSIKNLSNKTRIDIEPVLNATFHFRMQPGVDCTGTYISNTGHFITALHCISGCLAKNHALARELAFEEPVQQVKVKLPTETILKDIFAYKMTVDEDKVDEGIVCPGVIGDKKTDMQIVMTGGKGWLAPKETLAAFSKRFPAEYSALLNDGYEHSADFAIVQAVDIKAPSCLKLSQQGPVTNQTLHAVSYACLSREGLSTDGKTPLFTQGHRTSGFKSSEYFERLGPKRIPFQAAVVERKETFFSSLDMEKCGSGTAILDERSNVVGIATRIYKITNHYERGSLEAINVAQVWRDLMEKKSGSDIKEITTCSVRMPASLLRPPQKRSVEAISKPLDPRKGRRKAT